MYRDTVCKSKSLSLVMYAASTTVEVSLQDPGREVICYSRRSLLGAKRSGGVRGGGLRFMLCYSVSELVCPLIARPSASLGNSGSETRRYFTERL